MDYKKILKIATWAVVALTLNLWILSQVPNWERNALQFNREIEFPTRYGISALEPFPKTTISFDPFYIATYSESDNYNYNYRSENPTLQLHIHYDPFESQFVKAIKNTSSFIRAQDLFKFKRNYDSMFDFTSQLLSEGYYTAEYEIVDEFFAFVFTEQNDFFGVTSLNDGLINRRYGLGYIYRVYVSPAKIYLQNSQCANGQRLIKQASKLLKTHKINASGHSISYVDFKSDTYYNYWRSANDDAVIDEILLLEALVNSCYDFLSEPNDTRSSLLQNAQVANQLSYIFLEDYSTLGEREPSIFTCDKVSTLKEICIYFQSISFFQSNDYTQALELSQNINESQNLYLTDLVKVLQSRIYFWRLLEKRGGRLKDELFTGTNSGISCLDNPQINTALENINDLKSQLHSDYYYQDMDRYISEIQRHCASYEQNTTLIRKKRLPLLAVVKNIVTS